MPVSEGEPTVFIVEDDEALRNALKRLFRAVGLRAEMFGSAAELLKVEFPDAPGCLVLDIRLPGLSGLDLQSELARRDIRLPIVFMTGHGDIPMTVRAMKAGAMDFLAKPFRNQDLLNAVAAAIEKDRTRRKENQKQTRLCELFESLTAREREVMALVTSGFMNKQIAHELGLSEITVKIHRGNLMKKMDAKSLAELVKMAEALQSSRIKP